MGCVHRYAAFGLTISSDFAIPGLSPVHGPAEPDLLVVSEGTRNRRVLEDERVWYASPERHADGTPQLTVWRGTSGAHRFRYADGTEFVIGPGATRVDVRWETPLTAADAAVYLLGPVMGLVMRVRGLVSLHASAVMIDGRATLFVGDAGAGKSTTAAAFATLGYPVLSDDLVPLQPVKDRILALPSHPRLTLWPDSANALFGPSETLPALTPSYDKRYLDLDRARCFHDGPAPMAVIYVLGNRVPAAEASCIRELPPQAALMTLVSNTYSNYLLDSSMRAIELDVLARLARHVPVRQVSFGADIGQLYRSCRRLAGEEVGRL